MNNFLKVLFVAAFFCSVTKLESQVDYFTQEASIDLIKKGVEYHDNKEYDKALLEFKKVNRNDSNYYLAAVEMLNTYLVSKNDSAGLAFCNRLLTIKNDYTPNILIFKGDFLDNLNRKKEAEEVFKFGQKEYPTNNSFFYELGVVKYRDRDYDAAFDYFVKSVKVNPFHASSHYQLGLLAHRHNNITASMLAFQFYFLCDHSSKRATGLVVDLEKVSKQELENDSVLSLKAFKDQNYFEELESIIRSKAALSAKYKSKTDLNYDLVKQMQLVIENIGKYKDVKGFYNEFYGKFFDELNKNKFIEPYVYYTLSGMEIEDVNKWLNKNKNDLNKFELWCYNNICENYAKYDELLNGKKETVSHWATKGRITSAGNKNSAGEMHGYWNFYHSNGLKKSEGELVNGVRDGVWKFYYKTGGLKEESTYKNGKEIYFKTFYENNNSKLEFPIKDDQIEGELKSFYANGNVNMVKNFKGGKPNGLETHYFRTGQKEISYNNNNDVYDGDIVEYYDNGKISSKFKLVKSERQDKFEEFYNNSENSIYCTGNYKDNVKVGEWKYFFRNGKVSSYGSLNSDGRKDGEWKTFYENEKPLSIEVFTDGKFNGVQKYYDDDGLLWEEYTYKKGKLQGYKAYKKDGSIICDNKINGKNFKIIQYYPNANKRREGAVTDGELEGVWKDYTRFGVLTEESFYKEGKFNDKYLMYYPNGTISSETNYVNGVQEGYYKSYQVNGKLKSEGMMHENNKVGVWKYYNINGVINKVFYNVNDEAVGWSEFYDNRGHLEHEELNSEGILVRVVYYDTLGNIIQNVDLSKGTGILEKKNLAGKILYKKTFVKDMAEGLVKEYYADGTQESEVNFKNGKREGKLILNDELGRKIKDMNFFNDQLSGNKTEYFDDGKPESVYIYDRDELNGKCIVYHENGKIFKELNYLNGDADGESSLYDEFGELIYKRNFNNDLLLNYTYKDATGNFVKSKEISNGDYKLIAYFPNGKKSIEVGYTNGDLNGKRTIYFSNGKVFIDDNFNFNDSNGESKEYYSTGVLKVKENYYYGFLNGKCEYYYPNGKLKKEVSYDNGVKHGWTIYYDQSGKPVKSIWYYNDNSIYTK